MSLALALLSAGCASVEAPAASVAPIRGPDETAIRTDYTDALRCLAGHARSQNYPAPRVAVGHITDLTGASDYFAGRRLTQGATLMAITAVSDAGMRLVERYDMGVIQVELDYTRNGLVRDSDTIVRDLQKGQLQGADLYIIGGITEFNPNIRSRGADGFVGGGEENSWAVSVGANDYVIDVGIDLRLVDARSSEVLAVRSFRKQVVGREVEAGVFDFIDGGIIDIGGGQRAVEPVQSAVRTMIDRGVFEFMAAVYSLRPEDCTARDFVADSAAPGMSIRGSDSSVLTPEAQAAEAEAARLSLSERPVGNDIRSLLRSRQN
jgi:curli production assembly/transport component CsgG/holdfast attachment protein HfaB